MNNISIYGRITRTPELKDYTNAKGEPGKVCSFTVAVNRSHGEEADFFDCRIFGKRAEVINKFFGKGSRINVSGEMQCQKYTAKDGSNRYPWVLMVRDFDFVDSKSDSKTDAPKEPIPDSMEQIDEDIPF